MNRLQEMVRSRDLRDRIVFTGTYNRLTSMDVRARQIAGPLGATYIRGKYLRPEQARKAKCVIWVAVADAGLVDAIGDAAPQVFDIINPSVEKGQPYFDLVKRLDTLILNTRSTLNYLQPRSSGEWKTYVIPHHHCNRAGFLLPEERLAKPRVVGYLGQPEHLHDAEVIREAVTKMGLDFLCSGTYDLSDYRKIDIGIAWTRPEPLRDDTRSNIKLTNFCAHGIPSVVSDYESYRDVDEKLGGGACVRSRSLEELIEGINELARSEELRRSISAKAKPALELYSLESVAEQYRSMVKDIEYSHV